MNKQKSKIQLEQELETAQKRIAELEKAGTTSWGSGEQNAEALRESEKLFFTIYHHSPLGIVITRLSDNALLEANSAWLNLLEYTREEVLGKTALELEIWARPQDRQNMITAVRAQSGSPSFESMLRKKSGGTLYALISAEVVTLNSEECMLAQFIDITQRKQAEELIQAQRDLARIISTVTSSQEAWQLCLDIVLRVSGMDCGGIYLFDKQQKMFELIFHQGLGPDFVRDVSRYPVDSPSTKMVLSGKIIDFPEADLSSIKLHKAEGLRSLMVVPILHQGEVLGCLNIASHHLNQVPETSRFALESVAAEIGNVVIYQRTTSTLHESEETYRGLLNSMNETVWVIDGDTSILDVNNMATTVLGYTREELLTMKVSDFDVNLKGEQIQDLVEMMPKDKIQMFETWHTAKDGRQIPVEIISTLVRYKGKPVVMSIARDITARKQTEASLHESREQLNRALKAAHMGTWHWNLSTNEVGVSPELAHIFGEETSSISLETIQGHIHPDDREWVDRAIQEGIMQQKTSSFEYRAFSPEGKILWMNNYVHIGCDPEGRPVSITGLIQDITARKEADQALRASEEKYRGLMESLDSVIVLFNEKGDFAYANNVAAKQLECTPEQIVGKNMRDFFPEHIAESQLREIQQVIREDKRFASEAVSFIKGKPRWYRTTFEPIHDEAGGVIYVLVNSMDIHELKTTQQELMELNHTLEERVKERTTEVQDLYDNAPVGYHSLDPNGHLVTINQTELDWLGYSRDELLGKPLDFILSKEDEATFRRKFEEFKVDGRAIDVEYLAVRKDGTSFPVLINSTAIYDQNGQYHSSRSSMTDITRRKQAEEALRERERNSQSLLRLSRKLEQAQTHLDILNAAQDEVREVIGYKNLWAYLFTPDKKQAKALFASGPMSEVVMSEGGVGTIDIQGDRMMEEFLETADIQVVEDAQVDERTNKEITAKMGNRTLVNVPILMSDRLLGSIGIGTFWDEGVRVPTDSEREYLIALASHMAVTLDRVNLFNERKQAEEELSNLSKQDQAALRIARMGHWEFDPATGQFLFNDQYYALHGTTTEEAGGYLMSAGKFAQQYVHPEDADAVASAIQRGLATDDPGFQDQFEGRILRADGEPRHVVVWFRVEKDAQGRTIKLHGVNQDITERKQAENELKRNVSFTNALLDAIPTPVFYKNNDGSYQGCNHAFAEIMGKTSEEIRGKTVYELWPSEYADIYHQKDIALMHSGRHQVYESTIKDKDGNTRPVIFAKNVFFDGSGNVDGLVGAFIDITERKQAEEATQKANLELARAMRMKDEFLASMSHELRTPLTGILGLSEALQLNVYGSLTEKQKSTLTTIESSGRHLLDLINDILDVSKIEAGKLELEMKTCSLGEICQSSIQLTKGMASKKGQTVHFTIKPDVINVNGDARRLKQVIVNLLSNAVKFTPEGGQLGLDVNATEHDNFVRISVWDKGIGISTDDMKKLFRPFVQLDSSLARQQNGTGLGLALVQQLVELHGGSINVESTPGEGSRFTVALPCLPLESTINYEVVVTQQTFRHALIIEDNWTDAEHLARYARSLGIVPIIHTSGKDAVEVVITTQPDVIFLDIDLPEVSGWEVLSQLKSNRNTQYIPVIITSVDDNKHRATSLNVDGYLVKYFTLSDLNTTLENIQKNKRADEPSVAPNTSIATVMIVDDNEINIETLGDFLEAKNFTVVSAMSGSDFLEQVPQVKPDIVLMDIQMPKMDGLETTRRLRAHPDRRLSAIPVIALTALVMPGDRERCLEAGVDEYISKPFRLSEIVNLILKTVEKNGEA